MGMDTTLTFGLQIKTVPVTWSRPVGLLDDNPTVEVQKNISSS